MTKAEMDKILRRLDCIQRECEDIKRELLSAEKKAPACNVVNTMNSRRIKYTGFGLSLSGPAWSQLSGIPRYTLWEKLSRGMTIEEIYAEHGVPVPAGAKRGLSAPPTE